LCAHKNAFTLCTPKRNPKTRRATPKHVAQRAACVALKQHIALGWMIAALCKALVSSMILQKKLKKKLKKN
jgi:hypothetical protein